MDNSKSSKISKEFLINTIDKRIINFDYKKLYI